MTISNKDGERVTKNEDVDVARRWGRAGNDGDWATFGALLDEHATYRFHSQWEAVGCAAIVDEQRNHDIPGLSVSQDAFVADGSPRVAVRVEDCRRLPPVRRRRGPRPRTGRRRADRLAHRGARAPWAGDGPHDHEVLQLREPRDVAQLVYDDQRGHGRSDRRNATEWNLDTWADDIVRLCDALGN